MADGKDMELFYRKYGVLDRGTVVIVHGWLGMGEHWDITAKFLAGKGFRVIVPDLPDHGHSCHTDSFSYERMAEILHDFLLCHCIGNPVLMGHSMGGKIIMEMADRYKVQYKRLLIVDILPVNYPHLLSSSSLSRLILGTDLSVFASRKDLHDSWARSIKDRGWLALLLQNVRFDTGTGMLKWKSNAVMLAENMENIAKGIDISPSDIPAVLFRGENSEYVPTEELDVFFNLFPYGRLVTIPDSGHWVFVDNTEAFLREINVSLEDL